MLFFILLTIFAGVFNIQVAVIVIHVQRASILKTFYQFIKWHNHMGRASALEHCM